MGKSYRSKRHHKKHRGGEGEPIDNNSVLNMDEPAAAPAPTPAAAATPAPARMANATPPTEEEKKGLMDTVKGWFGGSKTKRVRFRITRKTKRSSAKRSSAKRSSAKRSATKSKRSSAKRSSAKHKRSSRKRSSTKRKGSRK